MNSHNPFWMSYLNSTMGRTICSARKACLKSLKARLVERALQGEMTDHLGYEKKWAKDQKNQPITAMAAHPRQSEPRPGRWISKCHETGTAAFARSSCPKDARRLEGFDEMVISLYARGMTTRDISDQLAEIYKVDASADLISTITSEILEEVEAWQNRPLDQLYPIVFFDALVASVRGDDGRVEKKAVLHRSRGKIPMVARKSWVCGSAEPREQNSWLRVLTELKKPWHGRYVHSLRRRTERLPGSDRGRIPENLRATLYRAHGALQPEICRLERAQRSLLRI